MTREEIVKSMSLQDAIEVLKDTNTYGTADIAKSVILKALEQEPILDKIRAELTEKRDILVKEARANAINPLSCYGLDYALLIIDKYRGESEGTDT